MCLWVHLSAPGDVTAILGSNVALLRAGIRWSKHGRESVLSSIVARVWRCCLYSTAACKVTPDTTAQGRREIQEFGIGLVGDLKFSIGRFGVGRQLKT